MKINVPLERWADRLEAVISSKCQDLKRVFVLRETDSTQDAAKRMDAQPGDVITTFRQTAGRGRCGRTWIDTEEHGVAVTIATIPYPCELLALQYAIGVARTVESLLDRQVQIKWPNDILVDGLKLAGILIEQSNTRALAGIGINVSQTNWPDELVDRAVSFSQLGTTIDRIEVLEALLPSIEHALTADIEVVTSEFRKRDILTGCNATFSSPNGTIQGKVIGIDPMKGLVVNLGSKEVFLLAATTSIVSLSAD